VPVPSSAALQAGRTASIDLLIGLRDWLADLLGVGLPIGLFQSVAVAVVSATTYYGGRVLTQPFGRRVARRFRRPSVSRTMLRPVRISSVLLGVALAANLLGLPPGTLVLSVTVFSAVVGIVLAPTIGTVIDGVFVLADEPTGSVT
jgi:small-conductance mechanosensitive channel